MRNDATYLAGEIELALRDSKPGDGLHLPMTHENWRLIAAALRSEAGADMREQHTRNLRLILSRIVQRHRKGLDLTDAINGAYRLLGQKRTWSPFRALPLQPEGGDA